MLSNHNMVSFLKKIFVKSFYLLLPFFTCYNAAYNQETLRDVSKSLYNAVKLSPHRFKIGGIILPKGLLWKKQTFFS